ncbi:MAG TPA: sodium:solute symporter [Parasegetibacter sp.]|jgi:SSS family solute:Na+ symporter
MSQYDWLVLVLTLTGIILYGLYKSKTTRDLDGYFLSNRSMPWYLVLLSIMGTQASAITFLSAPGQAFTDGMRFVQYYFGLPLAMVIIAISFVPVFNKMRVFTAYEYLEQRFDVKTRAFTSFLFLLQRGLSTGISIYAPSIILSSLLGWNIYITNIIMGGLLIIYTMSGGAKAVAYTQQLQFMIIFAGMFLAGYVVVSLLPENVGFLDALHVSGKLGKLNVITTGTNENGFNWSDRYNIWSGIIGGFFLALSYFGTDQSQVGRYLTAKDLVQSRMGLLMNGLIKVPMQFLILLIGALVFTFYQFYTPPIFFNKTQIELVENSPYKDSLSRMQSVHEEISAQKQTVVREFTDALALKDTATIARTSEQLKILNEESELIRSGFKNILKSQPGADTNDTNYIFLRFVIDYLPEGLVGLLIAVIFIAAWGSIAAALNSLSSSTMIDFHKRFSKRNQYVGIDKAAAADLAVSSERDYKYSRLYTLLWGIFCIVIAQFANRMGSLIEAVNVLGSLFYGVILGIFLVAFYFKGVKGNAVFIAALVMELFVIALFKWSTLGFLWLNAVGALGVVILALILEPIVRKK